ncbi:unnamed protein product [Sympodiomycopsis kandeliae]
MSSGRSSAISTANYGTLSSPGQSDSSTPARGVEEDVRCITQDELTDLRALQRTFDLAYLRTALSELSFGILVIKLFEARFQIIGLVYALLCAGIAGIALWRNHLAMRNQSKITLIKVLPDGTQQGSRIGLSPTSPVEESLASREELSADDPASRLDTEFLQPLATATERDPLITMHRNNVQQHPHRDTPTISEARRRSSTTTTSTSQRVIVNDTFRTAGDVILVLVCGTVVLELVILFFVLDM